LFLLRTVKGRNPICEKDMRPIVIVSYWPRQRKMWRDLKKRKPPQCNVYAAPSRTIGMNKYFFAAVTESDATSCYPVHVETELILY
jgi:hypothetical protein